MKSLMQRLWNLSSRVLFARQTSNQSIQVMNTNGKLSYSKKMYPEGLPFRVFFIYLDCLTKNINLKTILP